MTRHLSPTTRPELLAAVRRHFQLLAKKNTSDAEALLAAWEEFYAIYDPLLRTYCHRLRFSQKETDDLVQHVWIKVRNDFVKGFEYKPEVGRFRARLHVIAKRTAIDEAKMRGRRRRISGLLSTNTLRKHIDSHAEEPDLVFEREESLAHIRVAIQRMHDESPPQELAIFHRYCVEEQSAADIAADLEVTEEAVRSAAYRARKRLRSIAHRMSFDGLDTDA